MFYPATKSGAARTGSDAADYAQQMASDQGDAADRAVTDVTLADHRGAVEWTEGTEVGGEYWLG